jgi:hypothetical protein
LESMMMQVLRHRFQIPFLPPLTEWLSHSFSKLRTRFLGQLFVQPTWWIVKSSSRSLYCCFWCGILRSSQWSSPWHHPLSALYLQFLYQWFPLLTQRCAFQLHPCSIVCSTKRMAAFVQKLAEKSGFAVMISSLASTFC